MSVDDLYTVFAKGTSRYTRQCPKHLVIQLFQHDLDKLHLVTLKIPSRMRVLIAT